MTEREKRSLRRAESGNAGTQKTPTPTPAVNALAGQISILEIDAYANECTSGNTSDELKVE